MQGVRARRRRLVNARIDAGRAPKTVNGELSVLRQVLRHARLWYRFQEDYRPLKNTTPPVGQALTDDDQKRLFEAARSKPEWIFAYVASALAFYCGQRADSDPALEDAGWLARPESQRRLRARSRSFTRVRTQ